MRWTIHSWRWCADTASPRRASATVLRWGEPAAVLAVARLDLAYRAADAAGHGTVPVVLLSSDGGLELWWNHPVLPPPPFLAGDRNRWILPSQIELTDLAAAARHGDLHLRAVTQVGVTTERQVVLVDLSQWGILGVESTLSRTRAVLMGLVAALGPPPLSSPPAVHWPGVVSNEVGANHLSPASVTVLDTPLQAGALSHAVPGTGHAVLAAGRPPCGLWLVERHGTWLLEPLHLTLVPVGLGDVDQPESAGISHTKE